MTAHQFGYSHPSLFASLKCFNSAQTNQSFAQLSTASVLPHLSFLPAWLPAFSASLTLCPTPITYHFLTLFWLVIQTSAEELDLHKGFLLLCPLKLVFINFHPSAWLPSSTSSASEGTTSLIQELTGILSPPYSLVSIPIRKKEKKESEVAQLCPTLCNPMDCSLPGSSIHGILQARILEWVAISFSRRSSRPRDQTQVSCIAGRRRFTFWATREAPLGS